MKILYDMITILPFSLLLVMQLGSVAGIPEGIGAYAVCLGFSAWLVILRGLKPKHRLGCIGIATVLLAGLRLAAGDAFQQYLIEEHFWILTVIGFSLAAFLTGILSDRSIWVRRAAAAAVLGYCLAGTFGGLTIGKAAFALLCLLLLIRVAEEIQRHWSKAGYPDGKEHITRLAPVLLTCCLIVYAVPAPDTPYDWQLAKDIWFGTVSAVNRIYGSLTHPPEGYASIGFSEQGGFMSGLGSSDEEVLSIQVKQTAVRDFRLVGCISGEFQGREWVFDAGDENASRMLDTMETVCAVKKFGGASRADYLRKLDMQYENLLYNTHYIFAPAKIKLEVTREQTAGIREQNGSILSKKTLHYQDPYTVSCYVLNFDNPLLESLLDSAAPITEAEWQQTAIAEKAQGQTGYSYADYQDYRRGVYERYCHSYGISEKTAAVLEEIQSSTDSRFMRLKMLESYLRSLEYATDCGPLPDSVTDAGSFLDYFLFTSQKGYCKHFATAFVLMANEMGIPCRFTQGYKVRRDAAGNILVMQNNAHAWPEAYFDNVGWVAFEPTPGNDVPAGWKTVPNTAPVPVPTEPETDSSPADTTEPPEENSQEMPRLDLQMVLIPVLAAFGFLLVFFIVSRAAARRRYRRMDDREKLRYLTQQNLRLLEYLGFRMEEGETLAEFSDRIMQSDRQDIREQLGFIPAYEAMLYSGCEISEAQLRSAQSCFRMLLELVRRSKLRYRFLIPLMMP